MFHIDPSKLPAVKTRRALIVVDGQNDFLAEDGALPVTDSAVLVERIANLVAQFRTKGGEIVWVSSEYERSRSDHAEQILPSDQPLVAPPEKKKGSRRTRPQDQGQAIEPSRCPESFLTAGDKGQKIIQCVRAGTKGAEMHPALKAVSDSKKDYFITKTYYSAFKTERLLQLLRRRFVTEIFICGSLTNIGVMATAFDASSHGHELAIAEDCCGYRDLQRHETALYRITQATGCDSMTAEEVVEGLDPPTKSTAKAGKNEDGGSSDADDTDTDDKQRSKGIEGALGKLSITSSTKVSPQTDDKPVTASGAGR